ncbi:hypothetical protein DL96DRAFT_1757253 [Flagelloscypha sp. PMI_526]|nr:hypothetical protein DL96DRAFT_1757253 [Flagelloscypha sp. PMI_526]
MADPTLERKNDEGKLLLSLDSGWIESPSIFSQVLVVDELMHHYEFEMGLPGNSAKPHEVFDMIIGTGSGGILAAMLGPLKMTTREALPALFNLHQSTFNPPVSWKAKLFDFVNWLVYYITVCLTYIFVNWLTHERSTLKSHSTHPTPQILGDRLAKAIQNLVEQRLGKDSLEMKMQNIEQLIPSCKFAVTAMTSAHVARPTVFRGYRSRTTSPDCTLVDAIRATMANARLFPAITLGDPVSETYIGSDAGHPNPIETVLQEAEMIFRERSIAAIISIGSGKHETILVNGPADFPEAMVKLVSSAQAASERASSQFTHHPESYYRLDVDQLQHASPSLANVKASSRAYLAREEVNQRLEALLVLMCSRSSTMNVKDLGCAQAGGLIRAVQDIPAKISVYDNLKILSYAERASFNPDLVCLKGTRTQILTAVFDWMVESKPKPVVMWLEGVFGSGKSFVAHTVAVQARRLGILGASFFMTPGTTVREVQDHMPATNEPPSLKNLVSSLIIDLGGLSEAFRWSVGEILSKQPRLASATPSVQMTELLLPSLSSLSKYRTFVWVIDSFDELMRYPDRDAADSFFNTFRSLLPSFPANFIIFITSRPLPNHPLPLPPTIHHLMLDLLSPENTKDVDLISYAELEKLAASNLDFSVPPRDQHLAVAFRRKAGGHPLWLRVVREHLVTSLTPNEDLEELVNLDSGGSSAYNQLMNLTYTRVITRSVDLNNPKNRKALKHVVFVLLTLQRSLPLSTLLTILDDSPDLPSSTFKSVTSRLRALLLGFDSSNPLEFIHLSLRDFFTSSPSFSDLIQDVPSPRDLSPGHFILLRSAFRVMQTHFGPEILTEQHHLENPAFTYVAGAWPFHLTHLNPVIHKPQLEGPLSSFLDHSFIVWLEYHSALGLPFLFTREFLEQAKCFGDQTWNENALSRRQIAEKLDELRDRFEDQQRFDDSRLCSAVQLWRIHAGFEIEGLCALYISLVHWSRGLEELGLNGLTACHEAVGICRSLDSDECRNFKSKALAWILGQLTTCLVAAGRHSEALHAIEEAVLLQRQCVQDDPQASEAGLVYSLINFSNCLSDAGRQTEALAAIEEAALLQQHLVRDRPKESENDLALFIEQPLKPSLKLLRWQLAQDRPKVFKTDFAMSLNNLSIRLSDAGRYFEVIVAIEEAVSLYRRLVQDRPKIFDSELAYSLTNFPNCLSRVSRSAEALAAIEEATSLYQQLIQDRPKVFKADLARSLNNFSVHLSNADRHAEALASVEESVLLRRQLVQDHPKEFEADLVRLSDAGRHTEALAVIEEAISIYRQVVQNRPKVFEANLTRSLANFSLNLSNANCRANDSLAAIEEAVSLYYQLV